MTGRLRFFAIVLVRWSATLFPPSRGQWAKAMFAELESIGDDRIALDYAFGCLWASIKECIMTWNFAARVVRIGTPSALIILALIAASLTARNAAISPPAAMVFGFSSAIFASAAVLFLRKKIATFGRAAGALIVLYTAALLLLHSSGSLVGSDGVKKLYSALAVEGIFLWSAFLIDAAFLIRMDRASRTGGR